MEGEGGESGGDGGREWCPRCRPLVSCRRCPVVILYRRRVVIVVAGISALGWNELGTGVLTVRCLGATSPAAMWHRLPLCPLAVSMWGRPFAFVWGMVLLWPLSSRVVSHELGMGWWCRLVWSSCRLVWSSCRLVWSSCRLVWSSCPLVVVVW